MPEWLWPIVVGVVVLGLAGLVWRGHEQRDQERNDTVWNQLGRDSRSGMRKTVHDTYNTVLKLFERLDRHKERLDDLERRMRDK